MKNKYKVLFKLILLSFLLFNFKVSIIEADTNDNMHSSNINFKSIGWNYVDNNWYYNEGNGVLKKGWLYKDNNWYFLDYKTGIMATGWLKDADSQYYLLSSGAMATGWKYIDNNWYYFDKSGNMARGWRSINNTWYYLKSDGIMAIGFIDDGNSRYYLSSGGAMQTGWRYINNNWYYFDPSGNMAKGWRSLNNKWYLMNNEGIMMTDWTEDNGKWYYLNSDGTMATGWKLYNNNWYYLKSSGEMAKNWSYINSKWYLMNDLGIMLTGWNNVDGVWYYLDSSGSMATGWKNFNGNWYYLDSSGKRLTNEWRTIGGIKYWFNGEGIMATGESVISGENYSFDSNGKYLKKLEQKPYLYVEFLSTGDSDCIYIELPNGDDVLIDAGESWHGKDVVNYLKGRKLAEEDGIPDIDYVINTHPHSDHIGGLIEVFKNFKVNKFYYPHDIEMKKYEGFEGAESIENNGYHINCMNYCYQFYKQVIDLATEKGIEVCDTIPGTYIDSNNILKFIQPNKVYKQNYLDKDPNEITGLDYCSFNNDSAVIYASYYDFSMLLTSDIHTTVEHDMINEGLIPSGNIDVLKIGHHGYDTSTSPEFINFLKPTFGVVTRSKTMYNSSTAHVNSSKVLKDYNVDLLETWRGNIKVYATDKDYNVEY